MLSNDTSNYHLRGNRSPLRTRSLAPNSSFPRGGESRRFLWAVFITSSLVPTLVGPWLGTLAHALLEFLMLPRGSSSRFGGARPEECEHKQSSNGHLLSHSQCGMASWSPWECACQGPGVRAGDGTCPCPPALDPTGAFTTARERGGGYEKPTASPVGKYRVCSDFPRPKGTEVKQSPRRRARSREAASPHRARASTLCPLR